MLATQFKRVARRAYRLVRPAPPAAVVAAPAPVPVPRGWERVSADIIEAISAGEDLSQPKFPDLVAELEALFEDNPPVAQVVHRDIGKAIFERSHALYAGEGLSEALRRYTYPAFLSVALSSHCNAACFFCRESDYKGANVNFDDLKKIETPIRYARTIDLTGWGEPFFYPRFEEAVEYLCALNPGRQTIMVTSNGSFLSERWASLLRGRISSLVISFHAAQAETYEAQMRYKNKRFTLDETVAAIASFMAGITEEDRSRVQLRMVCNTGNFREMTDVAEIAARLRIPTVHFSNFMTAQEEHLDKTLLNVKDEYNAELDRARARAEELGVKTISRRFYNTDEKLVKGAESCLAPFDAAFVEMPGSMAPCCFMGRSRMGNVYEEGFEAVWFGETMTKLRESRFLPACQTCTIHTPFDDPVAHMSPFLLDKSRTIEGPTDLSLAEGWKAKNKKH